MLKLFRQLKFKEWSLIFISLIFITMQVHFDLKVPDYMRKITMYIQMAAGSLSDVWIAGGYMLLYTVGSVLSSVIVGFFAARIAATFSKRLRLEVYDTVQSFSMEEMNKFSTASLITRSTNDITQIQLIITMGLQVLIKGPILAVWALLKISGKNWQWGFSTAIAVFVLVIILAVIIIVALPRFRKIQTLTDNLNRVTRENLTGLRVVRAYNAEAYQEAKFEKANRELTSNHLVVSRIMPIMSSGMSLIMSGLSLAVYWIGAHLIENADFLNKGELFGDMMVFSAYAMQVVMAFMMMSLIFIMMPRAFVSARRVNEVLNTVPKIMDGDYTGGGGLKGQVEFKNVSFKYPDAADYVLKNINFTAKTGETVAFIGSTGSGKSTIINLIPRFYDVTDGEILVNGVNVKNYTQRHLRNLIAYVPQRAMLFSGTVESNIAFGDSGGVELTDEDIRRAMQTAQGADFVEEMDGSYQAKIAQGGANVSGGQKQRIAIARAIARNSEILIFDDSFSALDYKTDSMLRKALIKEKGGSTKIIVAQRIGTIKNADKIFVIEEGEIVSSGTHDQLIKDCKIYQEIAYSQLSKEELA